MVINNGIYGMTGGQYSPATPQGMIASTAAYGTIEQPFSACDLAMAAGASFVARSTVYHAVELDHLIEMGMRKEGFALVEAVSYCHTTLGRMNRTGSAVEMMRALKEKGITQQAAARLSPEERTDKIVRGVLVDRDIPEYTAEYQKLIERVQAAK